MIVRSVVLVEDDHLQAEPIQEALKGAFRGVDVTRIATESQFYDELEHGRIVDKAPDVFVIDVMLRWEDPGPAMREAPEEVVREDIYRAGLRCQRLLAENPATATLPIILFTVLEESDLAGELPSLPSHVHYMRKGPTLQPLIEAISRITGLSAATSTPRCQGPV